jgi:anti-sigma factor RsiW
MMRDDSVRRLFDHALPDQEPAAVDPDHLYAVAVAEGTRLQRRHRWRIRIGAAALVLVAGGMVATIGSISNHTNTTISPGGPAPAGGAQVPGDSNDDGPYPLGHDLSANP